MWRICWKTGKNSINFANRFKIPQHRATNWTPLDPQVLNTDSAASIPDFFAATSARTREISSFSMTM